MCCLLLFLVLLCGCICFVFVMVVGLLCRCYVLFVNAFCVIMRLLCVVCKRVWVIMWCFCLVC